MNVLATNISEQCCMFLAPKERCPNKADFIVRTFADFRLCEEHTRIYAPGRATPIPFEIDIAHREQLISGSHRPIQENLCASLLLREFMQDSHKERIRGNLARLTYTHGDLKARLFDTFSSEEINNAIDFLMGRGCISAQWNEIDERNPLLFDDGTFTVAVIWGIVQLDSQRAQPRRNHRSETKKVSFHLKRAQAVGLPATLTIKQWIATLDYFDWKCAYCGTGDYEVFEHYAPLFHGGGTTPYNCVPACHRCNGIKSDLHPLVFEEKFPAMTVRHVRQYLTWIKRSEALL